MHNETFNSNREIKTVKNTDPDFQAYPTTSCPTSSFQPKKPSIYSEIASSFFKSEERKTF